MTLPSNFIIAIDITGVHFVEKSSQVHNSATHCNAFLTFQQKTIQSFSFTQLGQCKANPRSLLLSWDGGQKTLDVQTSEGVRIMGLMRDYLAILRATAKYARALKDYFGMPSFFCWLLPLTNICSQ